MDGTLNTSEAGRVGQLLGVSHVLCAYVREHRLHPPQLVVLDMTLVDSLSYKPVLKMTAQYDASEQNVLLALDKYLRNRSARHYTQSSLDIILRSPAEYAAFVSAECMRTFSQKVWPSQKTLKGSGFSSDSKTKKDE